MAEPVTLIVNGRPVRAERGDSVAGALLSHGTWQFRRSVSGEARGPLCGMGICFECLVTVNGVPQVRACLEPVEDGMRVDTYA